VEIDRDGELAEIGAEREVILSAGAYQSPQILLPSGIGPAADLELVRIRARTSCPSARACRTTRRPGSCTPPTRRRC
jgi:choline dehydrogenase